jgi:hypothetical protein
MKRLLLMIAAVLAARSSGPFDQRLSKDQQIVRTECRTRLSRLLSGGWRTGSMRTTGVRGWSCTRSE